MNQKEIAEAATLAERKRCADIARSFIGGYNKLPDQIVEAIEKEQK